MDYWDLDHAARAALAAELYEYRIPDHWHVGYEARVTILEAWFTRMFSVTVVPTEQWLGLPLVFDRRLGEGVELCVGDRQSPWLRTVSLG